MKHCLPGVVLLAAAVGARAEPEKPKAPPPEPAEGMVAIKEVRPVSFTQPVRLYRQGKPIETRDVLALRVEVANTFDFLPKGIGPPLFMFGDSVCEMVGSPLATGEALVLAPRPSGDEKPELWLTPPGPLPQTMTPEATRQFRKATARKKGYSLPVTLPAETVKPKVYGDLAEFEKAVRPQNPKK